MSVIWTLLDVRWESLNEVRRVTTKVRKGSGEEEVRRARVGLVGLVVATTFQGNARRVMASSASTAAGSGTERRSVRRQCGRSSTRRRRTEGIGSVLSILFVSTAGTCSHVSLLRRLEDLTDFPREGGPRILRSAHPWPRSWTGNGRSGAPVQHPGQCGSCRSFSSGSVVHVVSGDLHRCRSVGPAIRAGSGGADARESDSGGVWHHHLRCMRFVAHVM